MKNRQPPPDAHPALPIDRAYAFTQCRAYGHAWFEAPSDWTPELGVPWTLRCERCGTERRDTLHRDWGSLVGRNYVYPTGYSYEGDDLKPSRIDFVFARIDEQRRRR